MKSGWILLCEGRVRVLEIKKKLEEIKRFELFVVCFFVQRKKKDRRCFCQRVEVEGGGKFEGWKI